MKCDHKRKFMCPERGVTEYSKTRILGYGEDETNEWALERCDLCKTFILYYDGAKKEIRFSDTTKPFEGTQIWTYCQR
jgi:hypothetical protein